MIAKPIDITGERYGRLTAIKRLDKKYHGTYYWLFKCDCGNYKESPANRVRSGLVKSCGCLQKPHGDTGNRLFNIWVDMRQRCKNDGKPEHDNYGNRGITVCDEWNDYLTFKSWALDNGYTDELTLDRVDVNGNYEPSNCRWATYKQQANNKRDNRYVEIDGVTHTLSEWLTILDNVTSCTVHRRIRAGWDIKKALTTPPQKCFPLNPEATEEKREKRGHRKPLIAYNDKEVLRFKSSIDAEKHGFSRGSIRKARLKGTRHHGYYWKFAEDYRDVG